MSPDKLKARGDRFGGRFSRYIQWSMWLFGWIRKMRAESEARMLLARLFRSPDLLRGTSLQPRHAGRWILLEHERTDGEVTKVQFGILRHPRPYAFSPQSHKVIEVYRYDVKEGRVERVAGYNWTRGSGRDAD